MIVRLTPLAIVFLAAACIAAAPNLAPDATFQDGDVAAYDPPSWRWDPIATPSEARVDKAAGSVTLIGGRTFLRSGHFRVEPETFYKVSIKAQGTGKIGLACLWWGEDGKPVRPHRSVALQSMPITGGTDVLAGAVEAPITAKTGQLRIVVADGTLVVSAPVVQVTTADVPSGKLLLAVDAAKPGPEPAKAWRDLTGQNAGLAPHGQPKLNAKAHAFVFDGKDDYFEGAAKDESQFDFDTDVAAGEAKGDPFTVVIYAKLTGRSGSAAVTKLADVKTIGWLVGVDLDEFGHSRVTAAQQVDNRHNRCIARFPGGAGSENESLKVNDGKFHLFVVHFTGVGDAHSTTTYVDGGAKPVSNNPWSGGNLSSGSIRSDAPLRIAGGVPSMSTPFTGEIAFVEIWSGSRLLNGMSCSQYSRFRWNDGKPVRELIAK